MANAPLTSVLRHIRNLAAAENCKNLTDGQLLDSFSSHRRLICERQLNH